MQNQLLTMYQLARIDPDTLKQVERNLTDLQFNLIIKLCDKNHFPLEACTREIMAVLPEIRSLIDNEMEYWCHDLWAAA